MPECKHTWKFPSAPDLADPSDLFGCVINNGTLYKTGKWISGTVLPVSSDPDVWENPIPGLLYNPRRFSEDEISKAALSHCREGVRALPVRITESKGYPISMFEGDGAICVHLLAKDYETDMDHKLDEMRFHRSRVNYINHVEPIGVSETVSLESDALPEVYLPLAAEEASVEKTETGCTVHLPSGTSYAILRFPCPRKERA